MKNACSYATLMAVALLFFACRKEGEINYNNYPDRLTCKVNGQDWQPQGDDGPFGAPYFVVEYYTQTGMLTVFADNGTKHQVLYLGCDSLVIGENRFRQTSVVWRDWLYPNSDCAEFAFDTLSANRLFIEEIDHEHKVLKGKFRFTLINDCGEKLEFTDGVLDVTPLWYP